MSGRIPNIVEAVHVKRSRQSRPEIEPAESQLSEIQKLQQAIADIIVADSPKLAAKHLIAGCSLSPAQLVLPVEGERFQFSPFESVAIEQLAMEAAKWIIDARNSRKAALEVGFALDVEILEGASQTMIAAAFGRTRANISKNVKKLCRRWGLPPNRGMKSLAACLAYKERQNAINRISRSTSLQQPLLPK
jgi:hypothetical protein